VCATLQPLDLAAAVCVRLLRVEVPMLAPPLLQRAHVLVVCVPFWSFHPALVCGMDSCHRHFHLCFSGCCSVAPAPAAPAAAAAAAAAALSQQWMT